MLIIFTHPGDGHLTAIPSEHVTAIEAGPYRFASRTDKEHVPLAEASHVALRLCLADKREFHFTVAADDFIDLMARFGETAGFSIDYGEREPDLRGYRLDYFQQAAEPATGWRRWWNDPLAEHRPARGVGYRVITPAGQPVAELHEHRSPYDDPRYTLSPLSLSTSAEPEWAWSSALPLPALPYGEVFTDVEEAVAAIDEQLRASDAAAGRFDAD